MYRLSEHSLAFERVKDIGYIGYILNISNIYFRYIEYILFVFTTTVLCLFLILPIFNGLPVHRPVSLTNVVSDSQPAPCLDFAYPSDLLCMTSCRSLDPSPASFLGIVLINILSCSALETYSWHPSYSLQSGYYHKKM